MEGRITNYIAIKPIIVGNTARHVYYRKQVQFEWSVYIRAMEDADTLDFIDRVEFFLHPTFKPNVVTARKAPFEVTKRGWGVFEVKMVVYFKGGENEPVELFHLLKFPAPENKRSCVERYDEFIFVEPTVELKKLLDCPTLNKRKKLSCIKLINEFGNDLSEGEILRKIRNCNDLVVSKIRNQQFE